MPVSYTHLDVYKRQPRRDSATGTIDRYAVYLSADGNTWGAPAAEGEFSNIRAHPVPQRIDLKAPVKVRYLCLLYTSRRRIVNGTYPCRIGVFSCAIQQVPLSRLTEPVP